MKPQVQPEPPEPETETQVDATNHHMVDMNGLLQEASAPAPVRSVSGASADGGFFVEKKESIASADGGFFVDA